MFRTPHVFVNVSPAASSVPSGMVTSDWNLAPSEQPVVSGVGSTVVVAVGDAVGVAADPVGVASVAGNAPVAVGTGASASDDGEDSPQARVAMSRSTTTDRSAFRRFGVLSESNPPPPMLHLIGQAM